MPKATVLIPTFDHGPTLLYSIRSALDQTEGDLEVFVVGDGVPDVTREIVAELEREDGRVRFFDNPKGPSRGELHRHAALKEARGEIVCYLSDDDLWLPDHVETMRALLRDADFAHALPLRVDGEGELVPAAVDLAIPDWRNLMLSGVNRFPLSGGAHTLGMYRRLPHGWRTTPPGIPTDLYMWQQFLADPGCRAVSGTRPTVINFPSPMRRDRTTRERLEELDLWSRRITDPGWLDGFALEVLDRVARRRAADVAWLQRQLRWHKRQAGNVPALSSRLRAHKRRTEELAEQVRLLEQELRNIQSSRAWKLLSRLGRLKARVMGKSRVRPGR